MRVAIEPALEVFGRDRHGYAVMEHGKIGARARRDDRDRIQLLAVRTDPGFGEPRKSDRTAVAAMDEVGPFALFGTMPFIVAVGRDQTAPPLDRVLEGGLFPHRLGARIDQD